MRFTISILLLVGAASSAPLLAQGTIQVPSSFTVQLAPPPAPTPTPKPDYSGLTEVIRAKFPLAITRKDLGLGWREVQYGEVYLTKGETQTINEREYLVAYKFTQSGAPEKTVRQFIAESSGQNVSNPDPDDRFELALLPLSTLVQPLISGQNALRSYKAPELRNYFSVENLPSAFYENLSLIYLRKISAALDSYSQTYLGVLPPLETAFAAQQSLKPFAENPVIFTQPGPKVPFKANPLFSGRRRAHLKGKGDWVIFYEGTPAADGSRAVLRLNGNAVRLTEKQWEKIKEISHIE